MKFQYLLKASLLIALVGILVLNASFMFKEASLSDDKTADDFEKANGPAPYILWQWMNGCVTKEGITSDLEAFKKVGIGGVQQFLVGGSEADINDPDVTILGDKWNDLMKFSLNECERLGLNFGTHNCPGWSSSGAPGLKAEDSMQKLIWAGSAVSGKVSKGTIINRGTVETQWNYYKDICLIAVPKDGKKLKRNNIIVILDGLDDQGRLKKSLPEGQWQVLRFGHTTIGKINLTAPLSGQGLEVDKMSRGALDKFWALYPQKVIEIAGKQAGKTFKRFEIDSYEAGSQDWTPKMAEEFKNRRGYDLLPWLVVNAGYVVESESITARFKYDMQSTINELFADNYYGYLQELINKTPGMEFLCQPYGTGHKNFDDTAIRGIGDMVMCEFWHKSTWGWDSFLPVTSNAHVNGKKIVAAEAFTGQPQYAFQSDPADLKSTGDKAFCEGANLFVLHASAHQPWPQLKPGMTMGWWGTQFGPSQTWWDHGAKEWIDYLKRCQLLLQKGLAVKDLCYLKLYGQKNISIEEGYKGDICSPKELMTRFSVKDNKLVLPDNMNYKMLVLPNNCRMEVELAKKIQNLVDQGAIVVGNGFTEVPGLHNFENDNTELQKISEALFGSSATAQTKEKKVLNIGKGKVYKGFSAAEALALENISKDLQTSDSPKDLAWIHRSDEAEDYYFISNQASESKSYLINFRIKDMLPEIWDPVSGKIAEAPIWNKTGDKTTITLDLKGSGSCFVVFRKKAVQESASIKDITLNGNDLKTDYCLAGNKLLLYKKGVYNIRFQNNDVVEKKQKTDAETISLNDNWNVAFQENRGAPSNAHFEKLISWPLSADSGIRFFSGTAHYSKLFKLTSKQVKSGKRIVLDLGEVKNIATITVNKKTMKILWNPPFSADITDYCKEGENLLEVKVTNLWPNRIIGDKSFPDDCVWGPVRTFGYTNPANVIGRNLLEVPQWVENNTQRPSKNRITFCTMDFFEKDTPLLASGLIGPAQVNIVDVLDLKHVEVSGLPK